MPVFEYDAINSSGESISGIIDAESSKSAREKLRFKKIYVTTIKSSKEKKKIHEREIKINMSFGGKIRDLALVTKQLSTLLLAGINLSDALTAMIDQVEKKDQKAIFMTIREDIRHGATFADALAKHPRTFDNLYISMVRAGEASGNLDVIMDRIAEFTQKKNKLAGKVTAAMTYPAILVIVGIAVIFILMKFAVPKIIGVLRASGKALPPPTKVLVGVTDIIENWWLAILIGIIGLVVLFKVVTATGKGRLIWDKTKLFFPVFGNLIRKNIISRFCLTLSSLLSSGIPVLDALKIVAEVINNKAVEKIIDAVTKRITEGSDISSPMKSSRVFPPVVTYMIAIGEESGNLEGLLEKVSESYEEEIEITIQKITSLIEPVIIVVLAAVVGFIVMAVILPVVQMSQIK